MILNSIKLQRTLLLIFTISFLTFSCKNNDKKEETEIASNLPEETQVFFKLSLAQWSLHKAMRNDKKIDPLDFAEKAKEFGFEGIEYVSQLYTKHIEKMGMDSVLTI